MQKSTGSAPHWDVPFTQGHDTGNWGLLINERWFSEGVITRDSNRLMVSSNYMPGGLYFDIGGHYDLTPNTLRCISRSTT